MLSTVLLLYCCTNGLCGIFLIVCVFDFLRFGGGRWLGIMFVWSGWAIHINSNLIFLENGGCGCGACLSL